MPTRGRPSKPKKDTAHLHYSVNVTPEQKALIDAAALREDGERFPSRWIGRVVYKKAREVMGVEGETKKGKG